METEQFEKRFGNIAVEEGLVTQEQVVEALGLQVKENLETKKPDPIRTSDYSSGGMSF